MASTLWLHAANAAASLSLLLLSQQFPNLPGRTLHMCVHARKKNPAFTFQNYKLHIKNTQVILIRNYRKV